MLGSLPAPRADLSKFAPRIQTIQIDPEKIGLLIGPGGKTIRRITETTGAQIDIAEDDSGKVFIYSNNGDSLNRAKEIILGMTKEISIGELYQGTVVSIKEFGAFVEVFPGQDGLVHVSELSNKLKRWWLGMTDQEQREVFIRGGMIAVCAVTATVSLPVISNQQVSLRAEAEYRAQVHANPKVQAPVMEALKGFDSVAYIRFASVYRDFSEAKDFEEFASTVQEAAARD